MTISKKVGENIRQHREKRQLSQGDLAEKLGVDRSYLSTLESGARNPSLETLQKIADVLATTVSSLTEIGSMNVAETCAIMPLKNGLVDKKKSVWQGRKWYHQRFDGSPYLIHMIAEAEITTRRTEKYGLFFDRHFCFFDDGKADWYIDIFEIERVTKLMLELSKENPNFSKKVMGEYEPCEKAFYVACESIGKQNLYSLSNQELIQLHDSFLQKILERNSSSSIIDGFALGSDRMLEQKIKDAYEADPAISKLHTFYEVFSTLTTPVHPSFVRDAELKLLRLVLAVRTQPNDKKKLVRAYRDEFFWIRNNYVDAHALTDSYFETEIARIESSGIDVATEIKHIEGAPKQNTEAKERLLKKLPLDDETLRLITITEDFTLWQDERKKATLFTAHYASLLLEEISRRTQIPTELLKYLSPREVSKIFTNLPNIAALQSRQKHSVIYWDDEGHEVVVGERVAEIKETLLGQKTHTDIQDFRGMTASLGKAQGRVKVIKTVKEIDLVNEGDILVTVMTRPDYVPAMRKAAAIVTDEGGITSHAAIVSRELKIPCVIGTKIATQTLKTGDLVQVDANHGLVRIIERAKN